MTDTISFDSIPSIHVPMMESLREFKIEHLEPRISFEVVKDVTIRAANDLNILDMSYLKIRMWDFIVFNVNGKEGVMPFEPGDYAVEVEQLDGMAKGGFPIRFRQVRVCLDGIAEKWKEIMNVCVN